MIILILFISCGQRNPLFNDVKPEKDLILGEPAPDPIYKPEEYWIKKVLEYKPAWGQHVNQSTFNNTDKLLGPPNGGGSASPDSTGIISLGSGGGYVIVQFDPPVTNHPKNIKGYDFIIFGNAFWAGGNPMDHWQEPAYVQVMKDTDHNGKCDDTWYLLKGSDTETGNMITLTYSRTDPLYKPADKSFYPGITNFNYPDQIMFGFFPFPADKTEQTSDIVWGYADVTPTLKLRDTSGANGTAGENTVDDPNMVPEDFYSVPDSHGDLKIDPGSGGGDAFKLEWAVGRDTGALVILDSIDFIMIINSATNMGILNEVSADIDAIVRVKRNE